MPRFGEDDRSRRMFEDGNRVTFERPVDDAARRWWAEAFFDPHSLTPEDMGDLLTKSVSTAKSIIYHYIDGESRRFSLRVEGSFHDAGAIWFVERSLDLSGSLFNADEMFIPPKDQEHGRGRSLMLNLMEAAELLDLSSIIILAQKIGRYAWLRMGFIPDDGHWRYMQGRLAAKVLQLARYIGQPEAAEIVHRIVSGRAETAIYLASLEIEVPSGHLYEEDGKPKVVSLGKLLFLEECGDWSGSFNVKDPDSLRIAREYVGERDGSPF